MKLADITPGMPVNVTRGYSRRPGVVVRVSSRKRVVVRFTDVDREHAATVPSGYLGSYFGDEVMPATVTPRREGG